MRIRLIVLIVLLLGVSSQVMNATSVFQKFENSRVDKKAALEFVFDNYGLNPEEYSFDLMETKMNSDVTSYFYQQSYCGLKVEFATLVLTEKEDYVTTIHGDIHNVGCIDLYSRISDNHAIEIAKNSVAKKVQVEDISVRNIELIISCQHGHCKLAYKIVADDRNHIHSQTKYIDSFDGSELFSVPLVHNCNATSAQTTIYGQRTISTALYSSGYKTRNPCFEDIYVRDFDNGSVLYSDPTNGNFPIEANTSLWGAERASAFYRNTFGLDGFDDEGSRVDLYVYAPISGSQQNASATVLPSGNGRINLGSGIDPTDPTDDWTKIEIVGHEWTHLVIDAMGALVYSKESGAINEGIADIMGIKSRDTVMPLAWDMHTIRDLSNPKAHNQPDTYLGEYWLSINDDFDYGGVHFNSGVFNYWGYLVSEGGSGSNDFGQSYNVNGIGIDKMVNIVFNTLKYKMTLNTDYRDARNYTIEMAEELYGSSSIELEEVVKAWNAVGVGNSDLVIRTPQFTTSAVAGSTVDIEYNYRNIGQGAAGSTKTKIFISTDNNLSADDIYLSTIELDEGVARNQSIPVLQNVTIPSHLTTGRYYIHITADSDDEESELLESNNVRTRYIDIINPDDKPDLVLRNAVVPSNFQSNTDITISIKPRNIGVATSLANKLIYILDDDLDSDNGYINLGEDQFSSLNPNQTGGVESLTFTVPTTLTSGNYKIIFVIDPDNTIIEENENNNIVSRTVYIEENCIDPYSVNPIGSANSVTVGFYGGGPNNIVAIQKAGTSTWNYTTPLPSNLITINDMPPGDYWASVQGICSDESETAWSTPISFEVGGAAKSENNPKDSQFIIAYDQLKKTVTGFYCSIYPNPISNNEMLNINFGTIENPESGVYTKFYDINGKLILDRIITNKVSLENFNSGLYFVNFYNNDNHILGTKKLLIR